MDVVSLEGDFMHRPRPGSARLRRLGDLLEVAPGLPAKAGGCPLPSDAVPEVQMDAGRIVAARPDEVE